MTLKLSNTQITVALVLLFASVCGSIAAQSSDQNFPTAVNANSIGGTIKARDIGDGRSTTHYYAFDGSQGDIFINVVTKNFNGDIDIFSVNGLQSLTKIVVFADSGSNETGCIIYLRKAESLLMRIQGRTPNDDPATYQIKFAGSFVAKESTEPVVATPQVSSSETGDVIVNSVGTIVEVRKKPDPIAKESPNSDQLENAREAERRQEEEKADRDAEKKRDAAEAKKTKRPPTVVITDPLAIKEAEKNDDEVTEVDLKKSAKVKKPIETPPDPMAAFSLVIELKDGTVVERPMVDVSKFSVEKGFLVVVLKAGKPERYSFEDVLKVTVE